MQKKSSKLEQIKNYFEGLLPPKLPGLRGRTLEGPQFTRNFEYKIDHFSKTKYRKNRKFGSAFVSEYCASYGTKKIDIFCWLSRLKDSEDCVNFEYKIDHNSRNQIGKLIFH